MTDIAPASSVVALGTFDGMHPGHLAVIDRAVAEARKAGMRAIVYTFLENPRSLFSEAPLQIMTPEDRRARMLARGVDEVCLVHFTPALAAMPPEEFVRMLVADYGMRAVVVGEDYTFGASGRGNACTLLGMGKEMVFRAIIVKTVRSRTESGGEGEKISSSRIRKAILENRLDDADALMHGGDEKRAR